MLRHATECIAMLVIMCVCGNSEGGGDCNDGDDCGNNANDGDGDDGNHNGDDGHDASCAEACW